MSNAHGQPVFGSRFYPSREHRSTARLLLGHLHAADRSPSTRVTYANAIDQLDAFLAAAGLSQRVDAISRQDLESFFIALEARGLAPATRAQRYRSLQQYFK